MPQDIKITCDQCDRDLTYTGNCEDYRLALKNEKIPSRGGFVTAMAMHPAIDRNAYFCTVECLAAWLSTTHPSALESYEKQQKHRAWLAERQAHTDKKPTDAA